MSYTFTNGLVATSAQLNAAIGPTSASGIAKVTPVANTPTEVSVKFATAFATIPVVQVTPASVVAGGTLKGVTVRSITTTGFTVVVYRTNTVNTYVPWQAWVPPTFFTTGQAVSASLLNQGAGGLVAVSGNVTITPTTAGTPKSATITFPTPFADTPNVQATASSSVPSDILGCGATEVTETDAKIWLCRGTTTGTVVRWIALGRL